MTDRRRECDGGVDVETGVATVAAPDVESTLARQLAVIAAQEYRLVLRNRLAYGLAAAFAVFSLVLSAFGASRLGPSGVDVAVVSLASLAVYLVPLAAFLFGYDAIVGAAVDGWLDVVFALPVERWVVVSGVYLGRAAALASAVLVGFGVGAVSLVGLYGSMPLAGFATFLVAATLLALAFLAVSVLVSTVATEKTHALGAVVLAWVWFVLLYDLVALGVLAAVDVPDLGLSVLLLANPVDVFRVLVLSGLGATGGGFGAVFVKTGLTAPVLWAALVGWIVLPLLAANRFIDRRSL